MGEIRAFIAIELPPEIKSSLSNLIEKLRPGRERCVKWVNPESVHLTLKFLGNIPEGQIVDITNAMNDAIKGAPSFELNLKGVGAFPNLRSPRVVWAGIGGNVPILLNLQKQIEEALVPLNFTPEKRKFSAHLTLGRIRDNATRQARADLGQALETLLIDSTPTFTVNKISLMKSTLTSSGAIYDQLASITLDKN